LASLTCPIALTIVGTSKVAPAVAHSKTSSIVLCWTNVGRVYCGTVHGMRCMKYC
jgi:hypothetical protein